MGGSGCVCMYRRVRQRQVGLRQEPNNGLKQGEGVRLCMHVHACETETGGAKTGAQ